MYQQFLRESHSMEKKGRFGVPTLAVEEFVNIKKIKIISGQVFCRNGAKWDAEKNEGGMVKNNLK